MRPDAIVFDLDGTLWDTTGTCAVAWNAVVARLGIAYRAITALDVRAVAGKPHLDGIREAFPGLRDADVVRLAEATALEDNLAVAANGGALYPDVRELVPRLRERVPLMVVSNCQRGYIETFFQWSALGPSFVDHECWGNTGRDKAENLRRVIVRNGLRAPCFVGDTDGDRLAARANGVSFVHVDWGFGTVPECDLRVARFEELVALVD